MIFKDRNLTWDGQLFLVSGREYWNFGTYFPNEVNPKLPEAGKIRRRPYAAEAASTSGQARPITTV